MITNVSIKRMPNNDVSVFVGYGRNGQVQFKFREVHIAEQGIYKEIEDRSLEYKLMATETHCEQRRKEWTHKAELLEEVLCLIRNKAERESGM